MKQECKVVLLILIIFGIILIAGINMSSGFTSNRPIFFGSGIPLVGEYRYTTGIPINSISKIHTLSGSDNKISPECCPSAYSTSSGCICPLFSK